MNISRFKRSRGASTEEVEAFKDSIKGMAKEALGIVGIGVGLKEVCSQIVSTRGEFQQLEVSFKTMLQDESAAASLMQQLTKTAAITPFDLKGVADGAKQLLAYGIAAGEVNDTLIRLGDIAAGLSLPLGDLVYLYGTTMTQGRMYTQDLRQFMGRGIPLAEELAKQFGVTKDKVGELVTAGKVGADEFKQAIMSMTNAGSTFGGLMEAQSATITGQISNIGDAIDTMFNEIGQSSEGIINGTLGVVSDLVESYERVGRTLLGLVAAYGVYKTACIVAATATKGWTAAEVVHYNRLLLVEKAQKLLNATMLSNPYVLAAAAIGGLIVALASMKNETELLREAEENYQNTLKGVIEAEEEHKRRIDELCSVAGNEAASTDIRREALYQLEKKYPDIFAKYDTELDKLKNIAKIKKEIAELDGASSISKPENELKSVQDRINALQTKKHTKITDSALVWDDSSLSHERKTVTKELGLTREETAEYQILVKKQAELEKQLRKNEQDKYILGLSEKSEGPNGAAEYKVSDSEISAQLTAINNLIGKLVLSDVDNGVGKINGGALEGTYTIKELEAMKTRLQEEQTRRKTKGKSSSAIVSELKKAYESATKAYNDFVTNKGNELQKDEFEKKAKELKDAADAAKKEYDKYKPSTDKEGAKAQKQSEKEAAARKKLARDLEEYEAKTQSAQTELLEDGRAKRLKVIEQEYNDRMRAIKKQREDWAKANKEAKVKDVDESGLTKEQSSALANAESLAAEQRNKSTSALVKEEAAAMRDYLKEYGTFQQQKLAIAEEYAEKIRKAQSEGEKLSLQKERNKAIHSVDMVALQQNIDWQAVFGGFTGMLQSQLKETLSELKDYTKTDKFKSSSAEDKKLIYEAIDRIQQQLPGDNAGTLNFSSIAEKMEKFGEAVNRAQKAAQDDIVAQNRLTEAKTRYEEAVKSGIAAEQQKAKIELEMAENLANSATTALNQANTDVENMGRDLSESSAATIKGLNGVASGLQDFASGTLSGAFSGLQKTLNGLSELNLGEKVNNAVGSLSEALSSAGTIGAIISAVLSILDVLKDGIGPLISSMIDSVLGAVSGILENILKGKFIMQIGESLMKGIKGIFNALTFGGFSSWFGSRESDKNYKKDMEKLTASNEKLQKSLDRLNDTMEKASIASAGNVLDTQKDFLQTKESNLAEQILRSAKNRKKDNFFGNGGHSSGEYLLGKNTTSTQWRKVAQIVGKEDEWSRGLNFFNANWNSKYKVIESFLSLSASDMKKVADEVPDLWYEICQYLSQGYKDATEYMEEYISLPDQLKEIEDAYAEKLTDTTFDSVKDEFKSMLLDMESDRDDFVGDFEKKLQQAIVNSMMDEKYTESLKKWYANFTSAMRDGALSAAERDALKQDYDRIVDEALTERDALKSAFGWGGTTESQSATGGYSTQLSEDTGTEIVGRATAMQDALYRIEALDVERNQLLTRVADESEGLSIAELTSTRIEELIAQQAVAYTVHVDSRRILAESFLELQQIRENTSAIIKPINSMKDSLAKIEKNTKDMI